MAKVGVLLLNLGGPERIQDVGPFLYNLFSDPEIIRLPNPALQKPLAWLISSLRAGKSQEAYRSIGGGHRCGVSPSNRPANCRANCALAALKPPVMWRCAIGIHSLNRQWLTSRPMVWRR